MKIARLAIATVAVACTLTGSPSPAVADDAAPAPETLISTGSATVETYTADHETLLSRQTFGPETEGQELSGGPIGLGPGGITTQPVLLGGGKGGSSSASGCRRVTVSNRTSTLLGFTAYRFNTWTDWCWNRLTQVVSNVTTGWNISDVNNQEYWRGINNTEYDYYDYSTNDGHPYSAFKHYRQGRFENCVLKYGCIGVTYPTNTLRSYYNGTWAWSTSG
jgi:hypothetical protein